MELLATIFKKICNEIKAEFIEEKFDSKEKGRESKRSLIL